MNTASQLLHLLYWPSGDRPVNRDFCSALSRQLQGEAAELGMHLHILGQQSFRYAAARQS